MTNIFWPVYKNLEREFLELMFAIHIDEKQLSVYSSKISDLILRAASDIESLAKTLYFENGGTKSNNIRYDDAIKCLNKDWKLEKKHVIVATPYCFLPAEQRILIPFDKEEERTGSGRLTFGWNNAYQNLKHDRANSLHLGSIYYLFRIMAALFVLNIYFKDQQFDLEKDSRAVDFPNSLGSNIFSIKLHVSNAISVSSNGKYLKNDSFDESLYFSRATIDSLQSVIDAHVQRDRQCTASQIAVAMERGYTNLAKELSEGNTSLIKLLCAKFGEEEYIEIVKISNKETWPLQRTTTELTKKMKYEALLNKNQV